MPNCIKMLLLKNLILSTYVTDAHHDLRIKIIFADRWIAHSRKLYKSDGASTAAAADGARPRVMNVSFLALEKEHFAIKLSPTVVRAARRIFRSFKERWRGRNDAEIACLPFFSFHDEIFLYMSFNRGTALLTLTLEYLYRNLRLNERSKMAANGYTTVFITRRYPVSRLGSALLYRIKKLNAEMELGVELPTQ